MVLTCGMCISTVFQLAHVVEKTAMVDEPMGDSVGFVPTENAIHQVSTTANFATQSRVISWFVGGLNYQIEHHLFPKISHVHYPKLRNIVLATCKELHIEYHEYKSTWKAFCSHMRYVNHMGRGC
jgi:linoleoyl-CoA desaturase